MLGTAELETVIQDNQLPAAIEEIGQTWVRVRLTDPQTSLTQTLSMGKSDFADLILHWRAHGCHVHPCSAMAASPADTEHP
jgi:hypothetical protein